MAKSSLPLDNDFVEKIKDELDGETYEIFVGQKNGADIEIIHMTLKQALRVAAREKHCLVHAWLVRCATPLLNGLIRRMLHRHYATCFLRLAGLIMK